MAHVVVTIAGRVYRMACDDGEERHLEELARAVESKILSLRERFSEVGESRVLVMTALTFADETAIAVEKLKAVEADLATLRARDDAAAALCARLTAALEAASARVETLTRDLEQREDQPTLFDAPLP